LGYRLAKECFYTDHIAFYLINFNNHLKPYIGEKVMKKFIGTLFVMTILITACAPSPEAIAKQTAVAATSTAAAWTPTPAPTPTPAFPSYSEIINTYPSGIELSCTDVEVSEVTPDGKFVLTGGLLCPGKSRLTVATGKSFTVGENETFFGEPWKFYGAKVTVLKTIVIDGKTYQPGSQLTVDKDLNWIQISSSTSTNEPLPTAESGVPTVQSVQLRRDTSSGKLVIYQDIHFIDSDGDVTRVDYKIVSTTNPDVQVEGGELNISSEEQKVGIFFTGEWGCGGGNYTVTLSVVLTDRAGHHSAPYEYTMNCDTGN